MPGVVGDDRFLARCADDIRWLHAYWAERCESGVICPRDRFDPVDLPRRMLPMVNLVEAVDEGADYRYRLVGTGDVRERSADPTGKLVSEAFHGPNPENALATYDYVYWRKRPLFRNDRHPHETMYHKRSERIFLPMSGPEDPKSVRFILVFVKILPATAQAREAKRQAGES